MILLSLGRPEEGLTATKEAVEACRDLAARWPDTFLPDLARSMTNLGMTLLRLDRPEEALAASEEAVEAYRDLAASRPDTYLPDLARSLSAIANALAALGRHEEATSTAAEALSILVPFVERYPRYFGDLAQGVGSDLLRHRKAAGMEADPALLERIARARLAREPRAAPPLPGPG
jgi:tetratricopeptide (TPR) repeat protein